MAAAAIQSAGIRLRAAGEQAPEAPGQDQAREVRRHRAEEHVEKEREDPGAAHIVGIVDCATAIVN